MEEAARIEVKGPGDEEEGSDEEYDAYKVGVAGPAEGNHLARECATTTESRKKEVRWM